ncbi:hypothetical protein MPH61_24140, partial [Peribacillus muralis]|uniref:hypothetical protein n=1 Tax=Peribacillus muralis TaxID=264697 RepID=UPI001F4E172E
SPCFSATISSYHFHSKKSTVIIFLSVNLPKADEIFHVSYLVLIYNIPISFLSQHISKNNSSSIFPQADDI